MRYIMSACLVGQLCKYNAGSNCHAKVKELYEMTDSIAVCPEVLGGLPVPRARTELVETGDAVLDGRIRVVNESGDDVTAAFLQGAESALNKAREAGITHAVLKARSPSCGYRTIYSGVFDGTIKPGSGVFAALLERHGFIIKTEDDI